MPELPAVELLLAGLPAELPPRRSVSQPVQRSAVERRGLAASPEQRRIVEAECPAAGTSLMAGQRSVLPEFEPATRRCDKERPRSDTRRRGPAEPAAEAPAAVSESEAASSVGRGLLVASMADCFSRVLPERPTVATDPAAESPEPFQVREPISERHLVGQHWPAESERHTSLGPLERPGRIPGRARRGLRMRTSKLRCEMPSHPMSRRCFRQTSLRSNRTIAAHSGHCCRQMSLRLSRLTIRRCFHSCRS